MKFILIICILLSFCSGYKLAQTENIKNRHEKPKTVTANESLTQKTGEEFSDPKAFVDSISNEKTKLAFEAVGDLNGDGLKDWAGVFTKRRIDTEILKDHEVIFNQLYVLTQNSQGKFIIAEKSKEGCVEISVCWVEELEIKNSSVFVNVFRKSDAPTADIYQFKFSNDKWRLVGFKTSRGYPVDEDTGTDSSVVIDRNLLTGKVIEEIQIGERKPKIKRLMKKFSELQLKDFEFDYENKY